MTTPHPTPEERYAEAIRKAEHDWLSEANYDAHREYFVRQELITAIREAEAAGEAKSDDVLIRVLASLAAAISLLERMPEGEESRVIRQDV